MPQVILSDTANLSLSRLADFADEIEPTLKNRVITTIIRGLRILERFPRIAKPSQDEQYQGMRELFIPFGRSGYVALYEYDEKTDIVLINAIRHTKESGYKLENS